MQPGSCAVLSPGCDPFSDAPGIAKLILQPHQDARATSIEQGSESAAARELSKAMKTRCVGLRLLPPSPASPVSLFTLGGGDDA